MILPWFCLVSISIFFCTYDKCQITINTAHPTTCKSHLVTHNQPILWFISWWGLVFLWKFHCSREFIPRVKLDLLTCHISSLILWAAHLATCQHYFASLAQLQRRAKGRSTEPLPRASNRGGRPFYIGKYPFIHFKYWRKVSLNLLYIQSWDPYSWCMFMCSCHCCQTLIHLWWSAMIVIASLSVTAATMF